MKCILVIDDDLSVRELLERYLSKLGYHVIVAKDGKDGINLFRVGCNVDVVITDVEMPIMDGNVVANFIRTSKTPQIPILAITGACDSLDKEHLFNMVLSKPFALKSLGAAVASYL